MVRKTVKTKTMKTVLLASALALPALYWNGSPAAAGPFGLPDGTSCDFGDPICIKDAAKWTAQDSKELADRLAASAKALIGEQKKLAESGIEKIKNHDIPGGLADINKAGLKIPGAAARAGQMGTETIEKIAHDRAGSTKGYVDRKVGDGVRSANGYTDNRIGDLGQVVVTKDKDGNHIVGNARWNTNATGQVIDGEGNVIRPHFGKEGGVSGIGGAVDGYYTVDPNTNNLIQHNAAGGILYKPGQFSGMTVGEIGKIVSADGALKQQIGQWLKSNNLKWEAGKGIVDAAGKIVAGIGDTKVKIGGKMQDVGEFLKGKTEEGVVKAGGKDGQKRDATVKEYVDAGDASLLKQGKAAYDDLNTRINAVKADRKGIIDEAVGQANQYTDMRFDQLNGKIKSVRKEARQAAAIGIASASLRYDDTPGKLSFSMGGGAWRGQGAGAFGVGYTHPNGKVRFNLSGAFTSDNVGGGGAVTYTFN